MPRCDFDHAAKARYGIKHILAFGFLAEPVVQHGNKIGRSTWSRARAHSPMPLPASARSVLLVLLMLEPNRTPTWR